MKKGTLIIIVVAVIIGCALWLKGAYNNMVTAEEGVSAAWSQVENVYQRRSDLIPNLVATVKGYAEHVRIFATVRMLLSVAVSTKIATP